MTCTASGSDHHHACCDAPKPLWDPQYASIFHAFWDTLRDIRAHRPRPQRRGHDEGQSRSHD